MNKHTLTTATLTGTLAATLLIPASAAGAADLPLDLQKPAATKFAPAKKLKKITGTKLTNTKYVQYSQAATPKGVAYHVYILDNKKTKKFSAAGIYIRDWATKKQLIRLLKSKGAKQYQYGKLKIIIGNDQTDKKLITSVVTNGNKKNRYYAAGTCKRKNTNKAIKCSVKTAKAVHKKLKKTKKYYKKLDKNNTLALAAATTNKTVTSSSAATNTPYNTNWENIISGNTITERQQTLQNYLNYLKLPITIQLYESPGTTACIQLNNTGTPAILGYEIGQVATPPSTYTYGTCLPPQ